MPHFNIIYFADGGWSFTGEYNLTRWWLFFHLPNFFFFIFFFIWIYVCLPKDKCQFKLKTWDMSANLVDEIKLKWSNCTDGKRKLKHVWQNIHFFLVYIVGRQNKLKLFVHQQEKNISCSDICFSQMTFKVESWRLDFNSASTFSSICSIWTSAVT